MTDDLFASFSRMLNLVSGVCLGELPISPLVGEMPGRAEGGVKERGPA